MRRFERRHVGAIPAGGTFGLKLNEISSVPLKRRVQVQFSPSRPFYCRIV